MYVHATMNESKLLKLARRLQQSPEGPQKGRLKGRLKQNGSFGSFDAKQLEDGQEKQHRKRNQIEHPLKWSPD